MRHTPLNTLFLIALVLGSTSAAAQKIYKCGTTYSQTPCPEGVVIQGASQPNASQKTAADLATRRDTLTADRLEKNRLQQEKRDLAANTPTINRPLPASDPSASPSLKKHKTKTQLEEFRAVVPGTGKSKKKLKSSS